MDVNPITMDPAAAEAKLEAFRNALIHRADAEYEMCAEGYAALAAGTPLISLSDAITGAGWNEYGEPNLAIARADRQTVRWVARGHADELTFDASNQSSNPGPTLFRTVPLSRMGKKPKDERDWKFRNHGALVPMIPADVRPRGSAKQWFILFEAVWDVAPPIDPMLLKYIGGDLYAVLAHWDLTEIERHVLAQRLKT